MAVGSSPVLLRELLGQFDEVADGAGCVLDEIMHPGLTRDEIVTSLGSEGLAAPEEVVVWFGWRNGSTRPRVLPRFSPATLERALDKYRLNQEVANGLAKGDPENRIIYEGGAGPGWLPLYDEAHGVAVECMATTSEPVFLHYASMDFAASGGSVFEAVSLCTVVTWWIEAVVSGAARWDFALAEWAIDYSLLPETQRSALF